MGIAEESRHIDPILIGEMREAIRRNTERLDRLEEHASGLSREEYQKYHDALVVEVGALRDYMWWIRGGLALLALMMLMVGGLVIDHMLYTHSP